VTPVEVAVAQHVALVRTSTVSGTLQPFRSVGVTSILSGTVLAIHAEEGSRVAAGAALAELDTRELSAQLRSAEATYALAKSNADRSESLFRQQVVTAAEYERDRTALASAEASVEQLRTRLGFARITAPISGVVTAKTIEAGDVISAQARLFTIADVSTLVVRLAVSELEVGGLKAGATVPITVDALGGASASGKIRRVFPMADVATRLVPVEVAIDGRSLPGLKPGFTVRARLSLDEGRQALTIPSRALQGGASSRYVFVLSGSSAHRRNVRAGEDIEGVSEVYSGLSVGDTVIVAGNALLRDGGAVRVVKPLGADATSSERQ
jgi:membrane fusion protein (multidrug efflux system)